MNVRFLILLTLAVLLQGLFTTLPLVWIVLLLEYIRNRSPLFFSALLAGIVLDVMSVSPLMSRSVVLILLLLLVSMYERKFEIVTLPFVLFASFLGSVAMLFIFNYNEVLSQALVSTGLAILLYAIWFENDKHQESRLVIS